MKVEQRIGRIDRIGQRHGEVLVLNLCYVGSVEEKIYGRLLERLATAGAVVGAQQMSLLPVTPEEFQELAEGKLSERDLEKRAVERARLAASVGQHGDPPADCSTSTSGCRSGRTALAPRWAWTTSGTRCPDLPTSSMSDAASCRMRTGACWVLTGLPDSRTARLCRLRATYEEGLPDLEGGCTSLPTAIRSSTGCWTGSAPSICPLASGGWPSRFPTRRRWSGMP